MAVINIPASAPIWRKATHLTAQSTIAEIFEAACYVAWASGEWHKSTRATARCKAVAKLCGLPDARYIELWRVVQDYHGIVRQLERSTALGAIRFEGEIPSTTFRHRGWNTETGV
jgi:hypothetical protein